jgi:hypothetical protein
MARLKGEGCDNLIWGPGMGGDYGRLNGMLVQDSRGGDGSMEPEDWDDLLISLYWVGNLFMLGTKD